MAKSHIITGLDIGTSNIRVLVALRKSNSSDFEVLAQSQQPSTGVRKGVVINVDEAAKNIRQAINQAQEIVGQRINDVYINIGGSHIYASPSHGTIVVSRADQKISQEDIERVIQAAQTFSLPRNKEILNVFPKEFIVDNEGGIREALGMHGVRLEAEILTLCAFSPYLKNLTSAVLGAGLQIADVIPSPLAAARACITPRQKELGTVLLDIGSGTTGMVVYGEGDLIHTAIFPVGSFNVTYDIAIGFQADVELAEKIKKDFGCCMPFEKTKREKKKIERPDQEPLIFSHKMLTQIIEARISEIFDLVNKELKKISPSSQLPGGVVLTGGGARLPRIVELAKRELKLPARIGASQNFLGLERDPTWSTACGLVLGGSDLEEYQNLPVFGKGIAGKIKRIFKIFIP